LKVVYENFYKAYNSKGADRLGIVYTPNEIVSFMVHSTDSLLDKHFGRALADRNVEILDPATGTGTFITEIIEQIPTQYLTHKYQHEIHANELAILPYYIANLNIEYSFQQIMGEYQPFDNIVFVDTLDNLGFGFKGKQETLFGLSAENLERIKRQNERTISVIIGNPPYNAKQQLYNDFNPNKKYKLIDVRIKDTYSNNSKSQRKADIYDMYTRFYRWAMDRISDNGVIAFITNRSFIDSRTFDGFRKIVKQEFNFVYIVDTQSDVRKNPKIAGTTHNVFGIQTGVAIMFLVKTEAKTHGCRIEYFTLTDEMRKREKLDWFTENPLKRIPFEHIMPDKNHNWINLTDNDFDELLPIIQKSVKLGKSQNAIFKYYSNGVKTNRDEWMYDLNKKILESKLRYFIDEYNNTVSKQNIDVVSATIKWDGTLEKHYNKKIQKTFNREQIVKSMYRPYCSKYYYFDKHLSNSTYLWGNILNPFGTDVSMNYLSGITRPFSVLTSCGIVDVNSLSPAAGGVQCLPLYRYDSDGKRIDNITDWGLQQFTAHYQDEGISKDDIFHYVYAVLHNPAYRQKYEINLKREFPRIPLYEDFRQWTAWGKALMDLHLTYETVDPYPLHRQEELIPKDHPKPKLRAIPDNGTIILDENTTLLGVPEIAWKYTLGNRSALHWILDQYKEKTPRDATIAEQFNTYRFAEYKEQVIDLLMRVCTVSVETMRLIRQMESTSLNARHCAAMYVP
jgi:predicted helicase